MWTRLIGRPGYVGVTGRSGSGFQPANNILDARQRWLFRMVHTKRPLQEKMALFWHNHFATAYSKVANDIGDGGFATRMLAAKPDEDASRTKGQIELFREYALGNFRDLLIEVAKDPAMLVWLDGRTNVRARPQENFARELMELFTMGVGRFEETDVYAGARVFTGWNLAWRTATPRRRATSSSTTRPSTTRPRRSSRSRSTPTAGARSRRGPPARACRTASISSTPWPGIPTPGRGWRASCTRFFVNEVDAPDEGAHRGARPHLLRERTSRSSRWCGCCCSRRSSRIRRATTSAIPGRSSSSCGR